MALCNLYSMTRERAAVVRRFGLRDNRTAYFEPKAAIFPGYEAPVIRVAEDGERQLEIMHWGFLLLQKNLAPKRVTNVRDDKILGSRFWKPSFDARRCLLPVSSYCEPVGKPASWYWHAINGSEKRPLFAFPGLWRDYSGPIRKEGENVTQRVFAFLTTSPNELETAQSHERMPVVLDSDAQFEQWLRGTEEEAMALGRPYPAERMRIVQHGPEKQDLLRAA